MNRTRAAILACAIAATLSACATNSPTTASSSKPSATVTPVVETPTASESGDGSYALTDTVTYENKVQVSLGKFTRGTSGEYASPSKKPYIKFTVTVINGSAKTMDLNALNVTCSYGDDSTEGEQIFDSEHGLDGTPTTHLRPGRTVKVVLACAQPKKETYTQIEVSPDWESDAAIFAGDVK